jgi:type IX secretion system PorP/SprF family membrane protein
MKKILILLTTILAVQAQSQDLHFSQFFETQMIRNPALTGVFTGDVRANMGYRSQWNSFTKAYKTAFASGEVKYKVGKGYDYMALGLYALTDWSGSIQLTTSQLMPSVNYFKSLSNTKPMYISVGFALGLFQRTFDASKITTNNQYIGGQYVPSASIGENLANTSIYKFDATTGISFNTQLGKSEFNNLYVAAAYHHFNKPNISFYSDNSISLAPKIAINAGYKFAIGELHYVTIQADASRQDVYNETIVGAMYSHNLTAFTDDQSLFIHSGLMYRHKDAIIPVVKIDIRNITIGVSYDANVSSLRRATMGRGGFECTFSYKGWRKSSRMSSEERQVICPKF